MCGICGIINFNQEKVPEFQIQKMMLNMKHRGPDDDGIFVNKNVGLGFVRLSIIDLSEDGHQPKTSEDGRYVLVFNGEIFNYIELRNELKDAGVNFTTKTDTEVLLNAYIHWGESCLNRFNGMWAFAIYDKQNDTLFASRDRYGIKPFYYYQSNDKFIFASEIPPILKIIQAKPLPNHSSIFDYLVFNRTDQNENTFFEGIKKLKHGNCLLIEKNRVTIKEWYNLKNNIKPGFKDSEEFRDTFSDAVKLRLRSDVPVGVCFSGGLDSSSIVSLIVKHHGISEINAFSAIYGSGQKGDESEYMNEYENIIKNSYKVTPTAESLLEDIPDFVRTHVEPIPSTSPYAQYKVMKLAKEFVTVTLDGQGADEELAGYHYFFGLYYKELLYKMKFLTLWKEIYSYKKIHNSNYAIKSFLFFLLPSFLRTRVRIIERGYLNTNYIKINKSNSSTAKTIYDSSTLSQSLLDHFEFKLEHLLKWEDCNSMRFSIEARVPFLDYRLVERTVSLSPKQLIKDGITKTILREAMIGLVPEKIRQRSDKIGFGTPEAAWFRTPAFKMFIIELLKSPTFVERGIIDSTKALKLFNQHLDMKIDISQEIWKWIHLELWFREFID